jgi:hypothetical protein
VTRHGRGVNHESRLTSRAAEPSPAAEQSIRDALYRVPNRRYLLALGD